MHAHEPAQCPCRCPRRQELAHQAGHGLERIWLPEEFRQRITAEPGTWTQRSMPAPPADTDRGLRLAADNLLGGLVRDFGAEKPGDRRPRLPFVAARGAAEPAALECHHARSA
ncbi:hypothetical protein [Streptomyces sp. NPDC059278]|uniref:hypothetical protein n=1 Tax=Streptomyces sp. NPDC059278 TaxID=3346801 RepID=UPI0036C7B38E